MSKKKSESIPFITPFGTLRYPKVSNPDIKGKYADGKCKVLMIPHSKPHTGSRAATRHPLFLPFEGSGRFASMPQIAG
jgi:hypothetical protein